MQLRPLAPGDASTVAGWAAPGDESQYWCGLDRVDADVVAEWSQVDAVEAFVVTDDSAMPIGYGELWFDDAEDEAELAHLIVAPDRRGGGVGRVLVDALVVHAHERHPLATLRVVPENEAAIRCYAAAGFERVSAEDEAAWNSGQPRAYVWMVRPR